MRTQMADMHYYTIYLCDAIIWGDNITMKISCDYHDNFEIVYILNVGCY